MKWLGRYVDISDVTSEQLQQMLTARGLEIASVEHQGEDIERVVVGRIEKIERHPDADKLIVCQLNVGEEQDLQIVTGADNVSEGDYVPVALHGSLLPGGVKIKKGKLRGVESNGMLCSGAELNLKEEDWPGAEVHGILILTDEYPVGTDIHTVLGLDDAVIEAEPTPNRPDLQSVIGVAREVACALKRPLTLPEISVREEGTADIRDFVKVDVLDGDLCPRYMARTVKNIVIEPSPKWMRDSLRAAGMRAINNIVDITNYVMLEMGQPMHAFDLSCIRGEHIVVRRVREGEKLTTLDGKERELPADTLLICDPEGPVGIAGIMGGENSEITPETRTVLFESAKFNGFNIRHSSKAMGMMSEASQRFVKGIDIEGTERALERACQLVEKLGAGVVDKGVIDVCKGDLTRRTITARPDRVNALVALDVPAEEMTDILNRLCIPTTLEEGLLKIEIPHFRDDIEGEADISEEVARIRGYDEIPLTLMRGDLVRGRLTPRQQAVDTLRNLLTGVGASECVTYSFTGPAAYDKLGLPADSPLRSSVAIINPFGEDNSLLRTTQAVSMLPVVALNLNRKEKELRLFEITNLHFPVQEKGVIPEEKQCVCIALYGEKEDFYTMKGVVELLCDGLDIQNVSFTAGGEVYYHPGRKCLLNVGGKTVGQFGEIHPDVAEAFEISGRVYLAEIELDALLAGRVTEKKYRALPRFPAVERDIALVLDETIQSGDVASSIKKAGGRLIESVELFDVYAGSHIDAGKKSLAYALRFRAEDRTLTDEEILRAMEKILSAMEKEYGAALRQ